MSTRTTIYLSSYTINQLESRSASRRLIVSSRTRSFSTYRGDRNTRVFFDLDRGRRDVGKCFPKTKVWINIGRVTTLYSRASSIIAIIKSMTTLTMTVSHFHIITRDIISPWSPFHFRPCRIGNSVYYYIRQRARNDDKNLFVSWRLQLPELVL